ncbi:MAG: hypothetical protein NTX11_03975 [Candidatus Saccharibacteria bacterium]|nr:hypothetical protein [Candidatus Saccharibacteria bacterium]
MANNNEGLTRHNQQEQSAPAEAFIAADGKFTPEHVAQLFFESYRFSQGNPAIQQQIFQFLNERFGDRITPDLIEQGATLATPRISAFVTSVTKHADTPHSVVSGSVETEQRVWRSILTGGSIPAQPYNPHDMLSTMLVREAKFVEDGGRPDRSDETNTSSRSYSKHLSPFVFYGLMGQDTGLPEYNAMFEELVDNLHDIPDSIVKLDSGGIKILTPILPVFESHFKAYPDDIARITDHGFTVLQERFEPAELQQLGIATQASSEV